MAGAGQDKGGKQAEKKSSPSDLILSNKQIEENLERAEEPVRVSPLQRSINSNPWYSTWTSARLMERDHLVRYRGGKEPVVGAEKVDELDAEVDEYVYSQVSQLEIKLKPII